MCIRKQKPAGTSPFVRSALRTTPKIVAALMTLAVLAPTARAQQGKVILETNEPLFAILAARLAAGLDQAAADPGREVQEEVRAALAQKKIEVLSELREFFEARRVAGDPGADLGQYISLALLLEAPPDFRLRVPEKSLPPDARAIVGLVPLLKRFYQQAGLLELWARLQPRHQQEMERYSNGVRRLVERSDAYLGFPGGAYLGRTYTIWLSLLGVPEQVHARVFGTDYSLVIMPTREPRLSEIRHQYLHFLLDPLAVRYAPEMNRKAELKGLVRQAPQLSSDFKEDFPLFVTECVIRAAELRMDKRPKEEAEQSLRELNAAGFILAPYFYSALADYEKQQATFSVVFKEMIEKIDLAAEKARLEGFVFAEKPETATSPARPAVSDEERRLNEAENFIAEGNYAEARAAFQSVLELNPQSERALFGLALVASNTRKPDTAERYFRRTLEVARDLRLVSWSHIYLGRIYDLKGRREQALDEYRAASLTAAGFPDALRAVQAGLQRPFGMPE
jgi:tetratricopeptide (TPR) repeat protein